MSRELDRLRGAHGWFTSQGLHVIRVHYPRKVPETGRLGACSCGKAYKLNEQGRPLDEFGLCIAPAKHPVDRDWNRGRLLEADDWESGDPWNLGLMCGPEHGLLVLDVDPRNGGLDTVSKLAPELMAEMRWDLGATFSYHTSSFRGDRGYHMLFRVEDPVTWDVLAGAHGVRGLDLKKSGMVVAVPSLHATGTRYDFREEQPPEIRLLGVTEAEVLTAALRSLAPREPGAAGSYGRHVGEATETVRKWMLGYDVGYLGDGERNDGMLPLIGALINLVVDGWTGSGDRESIAQEIKALDADPRGVPQGLWETVKGLNRTICKPPMPDEELSTMLHNVYRLELEKQLKALDGVTSMISRAAAPERAVSRRAAVDAVARRLR